MKAPKKIYLQEPTKVRTEKKYDNDVEYTHTDAFIDKACAWLENNLQGIVGGSINIDDFRKCMEE